MSIACRLLNPLIVICVILLAGCAGAPDAAAPSPQPTVRSLLEARQDRVVVQEWDMSCGAAALATVLTYQHGYPVTERFVAASMLKGTSEELVRAREGFSLLDMKRFVEPHGYVGEGFRGLSFADLVRLGPTIVPVRFDGLDHFVVFRGVQGDRVLLADPAFGNRTLPLPKFMAAWGSRIAFVVKRKDGRLPPNLLAALPTDFVATSAADTPPARPAKTS